jgi:hypothetical protein
MKMSKFNIVSVGVAIPGLNDNIISIYSMESLSSYDIIIFRPELHFYYGYDSISFSNGGTALTGTGYNDLRKQTNHWFAELNDALKLKKTVIILTIPNKEIIYCTGYSSPRKGEQRYSTSRDYLFNCLLPYCPAIRETKGKEIFVCKNEISPTAKQLLDSCKEHTNYEVVFSELQTSCQPLLMTKSNQVIGFNIKYKSGGRLLFWPNIDFEYKGSSYVKNSKKYWKDEAVSMGRAFLSAIVSLHKSFQGLNESAPEWILEKIYMTDVEKDILTQIQNNKDKQKEIETEAITLQEKLQDEQQLKYLLCAQGKELEDAVNYALSILGLKVENYHFKTKDFEIDNLIEYNGNKIIGETEGKDKAAIAVDKIRQLITNKNEYYAEEIDNLPKEPKGILFGNPERQKPLAERTLDFTDACKQLSVSSRIALVKTQDLFDVAFFLKNNPDRTDYAHICIETMINTESGIVQFPKPN